MLGCGEYEAYFKTRGGDTFVCRAKNLTAVSWGRRLNDVSEATVTFSLNGTEGDCCGCAAIIEPWKHELSVYRNGVEVWCGPVTGGEIDSSAMTARFDAKDLSTWFDRRWVELLDSDKEFEDVDIVERFTWLLSHGYSKDPFGLDFVLTDKTLGLPMTRMYVSYSDPDRWGGNYQMVGDEIKELAKAGIDYTVIRRVLLAGGLQTSKQPIARLMDQHWSVSPKITIVGTGMANEQALAGGQGGYYGWDDSQMWIERGDDTDTSRSEYGLLQSFETTPTLDDVDTTATPNPIAQKAYALRELKKRPFEYLKGGELSPSAPVEIDALIPGRYLRVDLNKPCRTVNSSYLLVGLSASCSSSGESISVELVPPGAEDLNV